jgi:CDP-glucose 4,6-dehydratase
VVNVTTDKVYEDQPRDRGYREEDRLGGHDPYSSSKACSETVTESYRRSFFPPERHSEHGVALASARAGNVFGGGDWALDRLVPDCIRALLAGEPVLIRRPEAVRPWQHVCEPLRAYLILAQLLVERGPEHAGPWNFGPGDRDVRPVLSVAEAVAARFQPPGEVRVDDGLHPHESAVLRLDCSKARDQLGWEPRVGLEQALERTVDWYRRWSQGEDARDLTLAQLEELAP